MTADLGGPAFPPGFEHTDTSATAAICLNGYFDAYCGNPELAG